MKTLKYLLIACFSLTLTTSCTDLVSEDYSVIDPSFFPKNDEDAKALVTSCYSPFSASWYGGYWSSASGAFHVMSDMASDIMDCQWGDDPWGPVVRFNWHANWVPITTFYERYRHISKLTVSIDRVNSIQMKDKDLQARLVAELKALRGWLAYMIYDMYGPMTIATLEQLNDPLADIQLPRATEEETQKFIETNLLEAAAVLPARASSSDYGRVSAGLCRTVLMKFYMLTKKWDKAVEQGRLIQGYGYSMMPKYKDIFTLENEGNSEIIHAATASITTNSELWHAHVLPGNYPTKNPNIQCWNGYRVVWSFFEKYDKNDDRLTTLIGEYMGTDGTLYNRENPAANLAKGAIPFKIGEDPAATGEASGVDWVIYRYADVLSMLGESLVRQNGSVTQEAVDLLNGTKARAGIKIFTLAELSTPELYLTEVLRERGFEFYGEGFRRTDLIRHEKYEQAAIQKGYGETYKAGTFERFPLPQSIINEGKGKVVQNPGY